MAWYHEARFYHIYPLGLLGAPTTNDYCQSTNGQPVARLRELEPWIEHIKRLGCNAIYIGPLFESVAHGYDTTDYRRVDSRLGSNEDLKWFVTRCHEEGIRVILDGVFNHTGRDFPLFKDIQEKRENSPYRYWYCDVNFGGNNEYNDGFSYANWGGYNVLVKLNLWNQEVRDYLLDVVRFWVSEFDIDGLRLDVASDLHFDFMHQLRQLANTIKPDFWLMGEVIHGDYSRWVNPDTLHSVTNYTLYKGLFSGHNDHNYFEIAHTVRYLGQQVGGDLRALNPYNFADNHDVDRLASHLNNKSHQIPIYTLIYTLPGVPSIYYGSEFGIEGRKDRGSDAPLRPAIKLADYVHDVSGQATAGQTTAGQTTAGQTTAGQTTAGQTTAGQVTAGQYTDNPLTAHIAKLGASRENCKALSYGSYEELLLTNRQYAFSRNLPEEQAIVVVNNDDNPSELHIRAWDGATYINMLTGETQVASGGCIHTTIQGNGGEIWKTSRTS